MTTPTSGTIGQIYAFFVRPTFIKVYHAIHLSLNMFQHKNGHGCLHDVEPIETAVLNLIHNLWKVRPL